MDFGFALELSSRRLQDMSSRRLQDVFSVTIFRLLRRLQDVCKMSCKMSSTRLRFDVLLGNKGKPPRMFSLAYSFATATSNSSKFCRKKYVQRKWIIWPSKLHQRKYVETTWIFRLSKLHRIKYVETTRIFRTLKLHWKKDVEMTWKFVEIWCSTYWRNIQVESMSIRHGVAVG